VALRESIVFDKLLVCSIKPHCVNHVLVQIVQIAARGAFFIVHRGHISICLSGWAWGWIIVLEVPPWFYL
jgi:hypothetical protein